MDVKAWIKKYEGIKLDPYMDTTGHLTIGYGRNLDNGISIDEAELMFDNDFARSLKELLPLEWFEKQPEDVQAALINMNFNLGIKKLLEFKKMIKALSEKDYKKAAYEALDSTWAKQVHQRAKDIALMISEAS